MNLANPGPFRGSDEFQSPRRRLRRRLRVLCAHADVEARAVFECAVAFDPDAELALVHSGVEAIVRATTEPFEIIVLDSGLTDVDCYEVCRWMNADAATRLIPVVMLADRNADALTPPPDVSVLAILSKPVDPRTLVLHLRAVLASAAQQKQ